MSYLLVNLKKVPIFAARVQWTEVVITSHQKKQKGEE